MLQAIEYMDNSTEILRKTKSSSSSNFYSAMPKTLSSKKTLCDQTLSLVSTTDSHKFKPSSLKCSLKSIKELSFNSVINLKPTVTFQTEYGRHSDLPKNKKFESFKAESYQRSSLCEGYAKHPQVSFSSKGAYFRSSLTDHSNCFFDDADLFAKADIPNKKYAAKQVPGNLEAFKTIDSQKCFEKQHLSLSRDTTSKFQTKFNSRIEENIAKKGGQFESMKMLAKTESLATDCNEPKSISDFSEQLEPLKSTKLSPMYFKIKYGHFKVDLDGVIELDLSTKQLNIRIKNCGENIIIENHENGKKYLYSYLNLPSKYKAYYRYAAKLVKTVSEEEKNEIKIEDKNGVFCLNKNGEFRALLKGMTAQESIEVNIGRDREVSIRKGDFRNREGSSYYDKLSPHYNKFASLAEFYKTKCQEMKSLK